MGWRWPTSAAPMRSPTGRRRSVCRGRWRGRVDRTLPVKNNVISGASRRPESARRFLTCPVGHVIFISGSEMDGASMTVPAVAILYQPALMLTLSRNVPGSSSSGSNRGSAQTGTVPNRKSRCVRRAILGSRPRMTGGRPIPSPSRGSRANEVRLAAAIVTSPGGVDERETAGPTATIDVEGSATMKNRGPRHG
jgi:hypothetical protein